MYSFAFDPSCALSAKKNMPSVARRQERARYLSCWPARKLEFAVTENIEGLRLPEAPQYQKSGAALAFDLFHTRIQFKRELIHRNRLVLCHVGQTHGGRVVILFNHLRLYRHAFFVDPDFDVLIACGSLGSDPDVLSPNAAPERLVPHILRFAEPCAKLPRRHVHERQHVAVLLTMDRVRSADVGHVQARPIQDVRAIRDDQNLVLRFAPLQANESTPATHRNVSYGSVILVGITKLSVVFFHADVGTQRFQALLIPLHSTKDRTDKSSLSAGRESPWQTHQGQQQPHNQTKGK